MLRPGGLLGPRSNRCGGRGLRAAGRRRSSRVHSRTWIRWTPSDRWRCYRGSGGSHRGYRRHARRRRRRNGRRCRRGRGQRRCRQGRTGDRSGRTSRSVTHCSRRTRNTSNGGVRVDTGQAGRGGQCRGRRHCSPRCAGGGRRSWGAHTRRHGCTRRGGRRPNRGRPRASNGSKACSRPGWCRSCGGHPRIRNARHWCSARNARGRRHGRRGRRRTYGRRQTGRNRRRTTWRCHTRRNRRRAARRSQARRDRRRRVAGRGHPCRDGRRTPRRSQARGRRAPRRNQARRVRRRPAGRGDTRRCSHAGCPGRWCAHRRRSEQICYRSRCGGRNARDLRVGLGNNCLDQLVDVLAHEFEFDPRGFECSDGGLSPVHDTGHRSEHGAQHFGAACYHRGSRAELCAPSTDVEEEFHPSS